MQRLARILAVIDPTAAVQVGAAKAARLARLSGAALELFAEVERQLKKDGVNLSLLWDEYARSCAAAGVKGYQYSQFCGLYALWRKERGLGGGATLRIRHVPGRLVEVDWAGARAEYVDRSTGEIVRPWVFVGCLPYSQRLYVEAFDDMKQPSWVKAHVGMLRFFGGVPELVTPDNCRTGVAKADYYDPQVNRDYGYALRVRGLAGQTQAPQRQGVSRKHGQVRPDVGDRLPAGGEVLLLG